MTQRKIHPQALNERSKLEAMIARIERRPEKQIFHTGIITAHANTNTAKNPQSSVASLASLRAPFNIQKIDQALDGQNSSGIVINALHEVRVKVSLAAASGAGFALCLGLIMNQAKSRFSTHHQYTDDTDSNGPNTIPPVFWISDHYTQKEYGNFYGQGLKLLGLESEKLIRIHPRNKEDVLWAAGEIAKTPDAAAFCLIEIRQHPKEIDLTTTRQLMLRAQASQTPVILLRQSGQEEASAAATRWLVEPALSIHKNEESFDPALPLLHQFIGPPAFNVTLEKCRGGRADPTTTWTIEWNRDEQCFASIGPQNIKASTRRQAKGSAHGNDRQIKSKLG